MFLQASSAFHLNYQQEAWNPEEKLRTLLSDTLELMSIVKVYTGDEILTLLFY